MPVTRTFPRRTLGIVLAMLATVAVCAEETIENANKALNSKDYETALQIYNTLAQKGNVLAQLTLHSLYRDGNGVPKNPAKAETIVTAPDAQHALGVYYVTEGQVGKGKAWLKKAAYGGNAAAQNNLGRLTKQGVFGEADHNQACQWFQMAAEQGDARGQMRLAWCYFDGEGMPKNDTEAVGWLTMAADQGYPEAEAQLGNIYARGIGVPQDIDEALKWIRRSANHGSAAGQYQLGLANLSGWGVPQDRYAAATLFERAANQRYLDAQIHLGSLYEKGSGVMQDYVQAHKWFNIAAASGSEDAAHRRDELTERMTEAQIASAQEAARNWVEQFDESHRIGKNARLTASGKRRLGDPH